MKSPEHCQTQTLRMLVSVIGYNDLDDDIGGQSAVFI